MLPLQLLGVLCDHSPNRTHLLLQAQQVVLMHSRPGSMQQLSALH